MILERAEVIIKDGMMEEFIAVLTGQAIPLTQTFTGIISFTALRGEEETNNVMFLAEWESLEAHLASRPEPAHAKFRELVLPYVANAKVTVHFNPIMSVKPA